MLSYGYKPITWSIAIEFFLTLMSSSSLCLLAIKSNLAAATRATFERILFFGNGVTPCHTLLHLVTCSHLIRQKAAALPQLFHLRHQLDVSRVKAGFAFDDDQDLDFARIISFILN